MMLAKLSFSPISTQISSVTTPASSSGISVSSTSVKRRSTIHSRIAIDRNAQTPASMKARTTVSPDSRIEIGPPLARRLDRKHGAREMPQHLVVVGIALGMNLDAARARRARSISRLISGGMFSAVIFCACERIAQAVERGPERGDKRELRALALRLVAIGEFCVSGAEPLGRLGARAGLRADLAREGVDTAVERRDVFGVGRGRRGAALERRFERFAPPG